MAPGGCQGSSDVEEALALMHDNSGCDGEMAPRRVTGEWRLAAVIATFGAVACLAAVMRRMAGMASGPADRGVDIRSTLVLLDDFVFHEDKPCAPAGYLGGERQTSEEACAAACKSDPLCEFVAFCPSGKRGCTGFERNNCNRYSSCAAFDLDPAYEGYTTHKLLKELALNSFEYYAPEPCDGEQGNTLGHEAQSSLEVCTMTCKEEAGCKFVAYCPSGNDGCLGPQENNCVRYSSCDVLESNYEGYTTYQKITVTVDGCNLRIHIDDDPVRRLAAHQHRIASYQQPRDFVVCFDSGNHRLGGEPLRLDSSFNRQDGGRVVWRSSDPTFEKPLAALSGGVPIAKWVQCDVNNNCPNWRGVWVASVSDIADQLGPADVPVRQLWVAGKPASRTYTDYTSLLLDHHEKGFVSNRSEDIFKGWVENKVELRWPKFLQLAWVEPRCTISRVSKVSEGVLLEVEPECWKSLTEHGQPSFPAVAENSPHLAPGPGEFMATPKYIFYRPPTEHKWAKPDATEGWVPTQSQILVGEGLHNHTFRRLAFRLATWRRASEAGGIVSHQTTVGWNGEEPVGAVDVQHSKHVTFDECLFVNIGAAYALALGRRSQHVRVTRSDFSMLSGGAVKLGNVDEDRAITTDPSEFDDDMLFQQNRVEHVGLEFTEAAAVFAGYVRRARIEQNTIGYTGYTAISLGWGWEVNGPQTFAGDNHIRRNQVFEFMQGLSDGGCIYTLGPQPKSTIEGNHCRGNPSKQTGFIYFDNGSRYFRAKNNVNDDGQAPCTYLQGCQPECKAKGCGLDGCPQDMDGYESCKDLCTRPALDIYVSKLWCRNAGPVSNRCGEHNCVVNQTSLENIPAGVEWPPEAQQIIDAAGASVLHLQV